MRGGFAGTAGTGGSAGSGGASGSAGTAGAAGSGGTGGGTADCPDPFAGGERLADLGFADEGDQPFGTLLNQGWDGRLYTDLSLLSPDNLVTDNDLFYVRTRYPDLLDASAPWQITVGGLAAPQALTLSDLEALAAPRGVHVLECSGNSKGGHFGLLSAAEWGGARVTDVLDLLQIDAKATRVLISGFDGHSVPSAGGHSKPGASWIFTFEQLASRGAFFALTMNGQSLPPDHGQPVRLFVPGWYGCTAIKWVNEIQLVDDTAPATSQMQEFASRTHQIGTPALAKDYLPASMDQAAMPVRVETWQVNGATRYRAVGILWGGDKPTDKLELRLGNGAWQPVDVCPPHTQNQTWTLWTHELTPPGPGAHPIRMRIADPSVSQKRLASGWYEREILVP
jgi:DMSO/TMAO reductase YedYZ molybdopterin-dependent catalytic subunit